MTQEIDEIEDLSKVYELLKKDAKLLVKDLDLGVSMYKTGAKLVLGLSALSLLIGSLTLNPVPLTGVLKAIELIGDFGLAFAGVVLAMLMFRRYSKLTAKYAELFQAAEKLE